MRIALATCLSKPEPDPDEAPLLKELRSLGADARMLAWDDPAADPGEFDLCVIRSTWNYIHHLPAFLVWARRASRRTRLLNRFETVRWNCDKKYLRELAAAGIPTVPTAFYPRGGKRRLADVLSGRGWTDVVLKPRVGAASLMTRRFKDGRSPAAERFLRQASAERGMMIQPYVASVETSGERSLIFIAGRLSHAVRKEPRLSGGHEVVTRRLALAPDERRFALFALRRFRKDLLYARVDMVRDGGGKLMLMELELIEPSLFLTQSPEALRRFALACFKACRRGAPRNG